MGVRHYFAYHFAGVAAHALIWAWARRFDIHLIRVG
jgi:hypothetical protein